jgi:hypothetical protein
MINCQQRHSAACCIDLLLPISETAGTYKLAGTAIVLSAAQLLTQLKGVNFGGISNSEPLHATASVH